MQQHLPPQNLEAEEAILGGVLFDPEAIARVLARGLSHEMFYITAHGLIFRCAAELHQRRLPTDLINVATQLNGIEQLDAVGGAPKLAQLVERTVSSAAIDRYADLVIEMHQRRQVIALGHELAAIGYEPTRKLDDLLEHLECRALGLKRNAAAPLDNDRWEYQRLVEQVETIEIGIPDPGYRRYKLGKLARRNNCSIGDLQALYCASLLQNEELAEFKSIDQLLRENGSDTREWVIGGWLPRGGVTLLHAMGGAGKTRLAYDFIYHLVNGLQWQGHPTVATPGLLIQVDETIQDMLSAFEQRGITDGVKVMTHWSVDCIPQLHAEIEKHAPGWLMIDSLSSASRFSFYSENEVEYARPVLQLTGLAQKHNIPILLIHHSARLGNARGSTAIENSVSQVLRLYCPNGDGDDDQVVRLATFTKSRARRPATYRLRFYPQTGGWELDGEVELDQNRFRLKADPEASSKDQIVALLSRHPGVPFELVDLESRLGINNNTLRRSLRELHGDGRISRWRHGRAAYRYYVGSLDRDLVAKGNEQVKGSPDDRPIISDDRLADHLGNSGSESVPAPGDQVIGQGVEFEHRDSPEMTGSADHPISSSPQPRQGGGSRDDRPGDRPIIVGDRVRHRREGYLGSVVVAEWLDTDGDVLPLDRPSVLWDGAARPVTAPLADLEVL